MGAPAMSEPLCQPCKERGRIAKAHRMVGRTPMCASCFAGKEASGVPVALASAAIALARAARGTGKFRTEEKEMPKRTDEATKAEVRKDHAAGMGINEIAKKHGIAWGTAKGILSAKGRGGRKGKSAQPASGAPTLTATAELCDGIWAALPLEKKAALLNRLHEVN